MTRFRFWWTPFAKDQDSGWQPTTAQPARQLSAPAPVTKGRRGEFLQSFCVTVGTWEPMTSVQFQFVMGRLGEEAHRYIKVAMLDCRPCDTPEYVIK